MNDGHPVASLFYRSSLNLYPTDYCNRSCVFCKMLGVKGSRQPRRDMSLADLEKVIAFCRRSGVQAVRILGGEPSQHPQIVEMIEMIYAARLRVDIIFTNGIFSNDRLVGLIRERHIAVNFHYFPMKEYSSRERRLVRANLDALFPLLPRKGGRDSDKRGRRSMSIIFYEKKQPYRYIIDAGRKCGVDEITWSFAHPSMDRSNRHVRWEELKDLLPGALRFVRSAAAAGIRTSVECPLTPCIFTAAQLRFARKAIDDLGFTCEPILDIFPDLSVHYCMGLPIVSYITEQNTVRDILAEQLYRSQPLRIRPRAASCSQCQWWSSGRCQGYCLQYKCRPHDFRGASHLNGRQWKTRYARKD